jgi:retinol-binding protein 3
MATEILTLDTDAKTAVIESLTQKLHDHYVFPDIATTMSDAIQDRFHRGEYDDITIPEELGKRLTADLQAVSHDKHVRLRWNDDRPLAAEDGVAGDDVVEAWQSYGRLTNYGFHRVERFPGNIGYLDLRSFFGAELAGPTAAAAMTFLSGTDAMIVDLRKNGGGDPSGIAFLTSYLFPPEPVHLNDLYWRTDDSTRQWWTLPWVPGTRYVDKPVYVLTSSYTFSGAEEFSYNLKNLQRATIVGEVTGGGAHPGGGYGVWERFEAFIPTGRAINPYSKTNWEGTGVLPDVEVPADDALGVARKLALEHMLATASASSQWPLSQIAEEVRTALHDVTGT